MMNKISCNTVCESFRKRNIATSKNLHSIMKTSIIYISYSTPPDDKTATSYKSHLLENSYSWVDFLIILASHYCLVYKKICLLQSIALFRGVPSMKFR